MSGTPSIKLRPAMTETERDHDRGERMNDEEEPLPAAVMIRLSAELGDTEPDDVTQDDG